MRARLVGTYLFLLILVLLALELPLAANVAARRTEQMAIDRRADAVRFASLAEPALRGGRRETLDSGLRDDTSLAEPSPPDGKWATLDSELRDYYELFGIAVAVVDQDRRTVLSIGAPAAFNTPEVKRWLARALDGEQVGADHTVWPWQRAPLAVAVPVITSSGEVVGAVLTLSPTDGLREQVRAVWGELAAGGLATGVVFVVVAMLLTRWILRPVTQLDAAAHRISGGVLDARVPDGLGPPELRRLARSFNTMAGAVTEARPFLAGCRRTHRTGPPTRPPGVRKPDHRSGLSPR